MRTRSQTKRKQRSPSPPPVARSPIARSRRRRSSRAVSLSPNVFFPTTPPQAARTPRRRRSSSPLIPSNKPPARHYRPFSSPGSLEIRLYEGRAVLGIAKHLDQLTETCTTYAWKDAKKGTVTVLRPANFLARGYIEKKFTEARNAANDEKIVDVRSVFAMLALDPAEKVVGYIRGTLYSTYPKLETQTRVMVIDLLCGQGMEPVKGTGRILLRETEDYARSLGVDLIVLFSVHNPETVKFYRDMGYRRTPDACHPGSPADIDARGKGMREFETRRNRFLTTELKQYVSQKEAVAMHESYKDAMQGAYYRNFNAFHDTVVMSKCLGGGGGNGRGGGGRVSFPDQGKYARFAHEAAQTTYRRYARDPAGRLNPV